MGEKKKYNDDDSRPANDVDNIIPADKDPPIDRMVSDIGRALLKLEPLSDLDFCRFMALIDFIRNEIGSRQIPDELLARALDISRFGLHKKKEAIITKFNQLGNDSMSTKVDTKENS